MKKNSRTDHPVLFKIVMLSAGLITGFIIIKSSFLMMVVKTHSMNPTMKEGDRILINRISDVPTGDIIAFDSPAEEGKLLLSRIIASEYETVEIRNKIVYVNDKKADPAAAGTRNESIIYPMRFCYRDNMPPVKLERNELFVLGDNFDSSYDSRSFGKINISSVTGKVIYIK